MAYSKLPELFPEEKAMPLARFYYDYPVRDVSEADKKWIYGEPADYRDVVPVDRFTDWLKPCGEYEEVENGVCVFPDGSGYIGVTFRLPKDLDVRKIFWYLGWQNTHSKSMILGHGNLRYKIWNPADHWDHYFVNWVDKSDGIHTTESLDMGEGERKVESIRHSFSLREFGLTQERIDEIRASGSMIGDTSDWESFDEPGAHITLGQMRPCPDGGYERRSVEWIGWRPVKGGTLYREPRTRCDLDYLRMVAYHTLIEWQHLTDIIDDLYEAYHDQPIDAD